MIEQLKVISPKKLSGYKVKHLIFPYIKNKHFKKIEKPLDGAAPKEVIKLYRYQKGIRSIDRKWHIYIVKTGHKSYPIESITEQLFTDIGKCLGMNMADTFLGIFSEQLKIASKYFLKKGQELVKGVEIYSEHLGGDREFVDEVENKNLSKEFITVGFTYEAILTKYVGEKIVNLIFRDYIKLLIFDAITGNNDRHFYNWGVVETIKESEKQVKFSPIYDTARGLFWNTTEADMSRFENTQLMEKYINTSKAKTSYSGKTESHFDLIKAIYNNKEQFNIKGELFAEFLKPEKLDKIKIMLDKKYDSLLSELRLNLIEECLKKRFNKIKSIIDDK